MTGPAKTIIKALTEAARADDLVGARALLRTFPQAVAHWQPIMTAAYYGSAKVAKLLLDRGAEPDIEAQNSFRHRPLHRCLEPKKTIQQGPGHLLVVKHLLSAGADPTLTAGPGRWTALGQAATAAHMEAIALLREAAPALDIFHAAALYEQDGLNLVLKRARSTADVIDEVGRSPLHWLARSGLHAVEGHGPEESVALAKQLLEAGIPVNAKDREHGNTALWLLVAWQAENHMLARYLLENGADPDLCMFPASYNGDMKMLELLHRFKATLDPVAFNGHTPLLHSVKHKSYEALPWLLEKGADPNSVNGEGDTALHEAVRAKASPWVLESLIRHGADLGKRNAKGETATTLARRLKQFKALAVLTQA